jgi:integrase
MSGAVEAVHAYAIRKGAHEPITPAFKDRRVSRITESHVFQFIAKLQAAGLSARRINLVIMVLKQILRMAIRRHLIRVDPVIAVRSLPEPDVEIDPFSPAEITAFLAACPRWWRPYFTVAFWTGARPNEMAALKVTNVDDAAGRFRICAGRSMGVEGTPKTKSSIRDVDMIPVVAKAIATQRAQVAARRLKLGVGAPEPGKDYLFLGPSLGFVAINRLREKIWYGTLEQAKLRRRTMYQTRHSFASNALAAGEDPAWIARMMGHKDTTILFKVYARFIRNRTRRDGNALATHMAASGQPDGVTERVAAE